MICSQAQAKPYLAMSKSTISKDGNDKCRRKAVRPANLLMAMRCPLQNAKCSPASPAFAEEYFDNEEMNE